MRLNLGSLVERQKRKAMRLKFYNYAEFGNRINGFTTSQNAITRPSTKNTLCNYKIELAQHLPKLPIFPRTHQKNYVEWHKTSLCLTSLNQCALNKTVKRLY